MSTTLNDSALPSRSGREVEFSRWVEKVYCFRHFLAPRRRSQVVRQRSAKPLFVGSIPTGASQEHNDLADLGRIDLPSTAGHTAGPRVT